MSNKITLNSKYSFCDDKINIVNKNSTDKNRIELSFKRKECGNIELEHQYINGIHISDWKSNFNRDIRFLETIPKPMLSMLFSLKGEVLSSVKSLEPQIFKEGENNICSVPEGDIGFLDFSDKTNYSSVCIGLEETYLYELVNKYPAIIENIYKKHIKQEAFCFRDKNMRTTQEMNTCLAQLKDAHLMGNTCIMYQEAKVLELLALQLREDNIDHNREKVYCKNSRDISKIEEAKELLINDLSNSPTIIELSHKIGINDYKLKNGFKEIYNQTIYGYLFCYKMNLAKQLITQSSLNINEIGIECGYKHASHFTSAFKRQYGMSPKVFRELL